MILLVVSQQLYILEARYDTDNPDLLPFEEHSINVDGNWDCHG